ncbi:type IV pilus modification protein PilV [Microbulbifer magnicolonia]|uniref:type IV pilus modification protein PilV n=1 Tax=Microbulbifer magnicolonia TaxID=3109744 RepID=UPI002B401BC2|nr:type IV pilus modification protein PilV [Microbulbifer sp. GG15]
MKNQRGATLIEILVTVLVLAVGLLGLGATQMVSLKNGNNANVTYFATLAAYDIAERMRINPLGVENGAYDATDVDGNQTPKSCVSGICSTLELAAMDLYEWGQTLSANLPEGKGTIAIDDGEATITVNWTEQHTGENYGKSTGGAEEKSFEMVAEL